jgi:hypothetical protein
MNSTESLTKCLDPKCNKPLISREYFKGIPIYICEDGHRTGYYQEESNDTYFKVA